MPSYIWHSLTSIHDIVASHWFFIGLNTSVWCILITLLICGCNWRRRREWYKMVENRMLFMTNITILHLTLTTWYIFHRLTLVVFNQRWFSFDVCCCKYFVVMLHSSVLPNLQFRVSTAVATPLDNLLNWIKLGCVFVRWCLVCCVLSRVDIQYC